MLRRVLTIALLSIATAPLLRADEGVDFENDVMPILTRYGCNAGACHGKSGGQGGFQLSLLGFDANGDYDVITKHARGRRVFAADPDKSLLLTKPSAVLPHGGGRRLHVKSAEYKLLRDWIAMGAQRRIEGAAKLVAVRVKPVAAVLRKDQTRTLAVTAQYEDGSTRDVTRLTSFQSNESPIARVDENGVITGGMITGEAAVMARYMSRFAVCSVTVPLESAVPPDVYAKLPRQSFIDDLVWKKLQRLNITPSPLCDDSTFLRRATTDIVGRIPRTDEVREFLADTSADKRRKLVDRLLDDPEFADHWANKWVDLLRPNPYRVGIKTVLNYDAWIRQSFRDDKPWDQFVKELMTAQGGTWHNGAVTLYRDRRSPDEITTMVSQLFLGIRLDCAKCHHHPFEVWGQDDFYSFAAYFAKVGRKGTGLSPPISGSEEYIYAGTRGSVRHPLTAEEMQPRPLFGTAASTEKSRDPRVQLADWMTSKDNKFFAQVMANRVWADLMGRGLVEPVDDIRATNPASNQQLLAALGKDFSDNGFSITHLVRRIANSHVYQLSSLSNARNVADTRNYSRHYRQRMRAEVLLDAVAQVTGVPEKFSAMPAGSSAKQIWTHRVGSQFLDAFGRPDANQDPPCERTTESTVVQLLHLMNAENLYGKVTSDNGTVAKLAVSKALPDDVVRNLYQLVYARVPTAEELSYAVSLFGKEGTSRRAVIEDLMWALLNTPEFVFQN